MLLAHLACGPVAQNDYIVFRLAHGHDKTPPLSVQLVFGDSVAGDSRVFVVEKYKYRAYGNSG